MSSADTLALRGGPRAVKSPLPLMRPGALRIGSDEEAAVLAALRARVLYRYDASPSTVAELERRMTGRLGVPHALAVSSGTAALTCALVGLGIGPGDEVIVPAYTWIAVPNAVLLAGAVPIVAEIDDTLGMDASDAARKRTPATRAIVAVHMRGASCRMDALGALGLPLIEDVAQAPGASFRGQPLGSFGAAAAFSFQAYKVLTAGEGGLLVTDDRETFLRAAAHHDYDSPTYFGVPESEFRARAAYGHSLRMNELEGALALAQLDRLDGTIAAMRAKKARLVESISATLARHGCERRAEADPHGELGLALIFLLPDGAKARAVANALRAEGVDGAFVLYDPAQPDYHVYAHWTPILEKRTPSGKAGPWDWLGRRVDYAPDMCPRASERLARAVHLDVSPELSDEQLEQIGDAIRKVLNGLA